MANTAAKKFIEKWSGRGDEKQDTQTFWNELIYKVLDSPDMEIDYEKRVKVNEQTKFIDAYIPATRVLIEQKTYGIDLMKSELQSDGVKLTPYEQGRRYGGYLPFDEQPRWIIDSNFGEIRVHDMKKPGDPPEIIKLEDLETDYTRLKFIVNMEDEHIKKEFEVSVKAGEIVGVLYDKLLEQYDNPDEHALQSLNRVCVRIVFCLYAEDAGLFGNNTHAFHDYMEQFNGPARFRNGLKEFFSVLNQPIEERDKYLDPELAAFPYVNGELFADDNIEMPFFTDDIVDIILKQASSNFDWSDISPTIFGAIFESTLNPETRRSGGMHYTSIENIHKVIDPLFLDELKAELSSIKAEPVDRTRNRKLKEYQDKIANFKFLDPACGSGNFLTESYLCLRRLENDVIHELNKGQIMLAYEGMKSPIKVSINQFYGIEINDFACATAQTAMWIAEAKTMKETELLINQDFEFFPLTTNANIVENNALRMDWNDVITAEKLDYIMGNPPFVGQAKKKPEQADDMQLIFGKGSPETKLDYVICWYKKAVDYIKESSVQCAFVSTNSICQGESVPTFWKNLFDQGITINFAYTSFKWTSEASQSAAVHCVIVGFSFIEKNDKRLFDESGNIKHAKYINAYLFDNQNIWLQSRINKPLNGLPVMTKGSEPTDGGNLFLTPAERDSLIYAYPETESFIKPFIGGKEYVQNKVGEVTRYCLWLKNADPSIFLKIPEIRERLKRISEKRASSSADRIQRMADYPYLFCQERQPDNTYLLFPRHTTSGRKYIPFGFIDKGVIVGDSCTISKEASLYDFGLLESNVHMAWTKVVCGRLGEEIRYSQLVYNNFPTPNPTKEQIEKIEMTAKMILDARKLFPERSLSVLYDDLAMPMELREAHRANDRAVIEAYGFNIKMTEQECVAELMKMYQMMTIDK